MKVTPKDFFLWAGAMIALYFSIGSFIALSFEYINRLVGDPTTLGYDPYSSGIRFAIASLVVLFPVFIVLTRMLHQDIRRTPEKRELWVRRWLVFLTIFGSAVAMIIDLIVLINTFLGGEELTAAFLLKVLTIFVVFGGVFYYYIHDIRGTWERNEKRSKTIGSVVSALLIASIIGGFFIMGSPYTQRMLRYDNDRVSDLQNLQSSITEYYRTTSHLPESLETLKDPLVDTYVPVDPQSEAEYEYLQTDTLTFELCATFARATSQDQISTAKVRDPWQQQTASDWSHDAGHMCFTRTIDPERITPYKKAL